MHALSSSVITVIISNEIDYTLAQLSKKLAAKENIKERYPGKLLISISLGLLQFVLSLIRLNCVFSFG